MGSRPVIYLIGIGMGGVGQMTDQAFDCLEAAEAVMGADRMLASVEDLIQGKPTLCSYKPGEMVQWLSALTWQEAALVLSGDTGFFSGAEAASKAFEREGWDVEWIPGISSLSYFCSRLGKSWQNVRAVSCHGRDCDLAAEVRANEEVFALLGGQGGVSAVCRELVANGLGSVSIWAGENFSYIEERITQEMKPAELLMEDEARPFDSLACVLVKNPHAVQGKAWNSPLPKDEDFIRGKVPMTKETVRRITLDKLRLGPDAVCYDIGAGTGSISVEMGLEIRRQCGCGRVYAIEKDEEALELIRANGRKFHGSWKGFYVVPGEAPEVLEELEPPTHAFIGGSSGRMKEMIRCLLEKNPQVRIVVNAITLETVGEILASMKEYGFEEGEILQVMAAPVQKIGRFHMPKAQNPVYVAVMQHPLEEMEEITWQDL